MISNNYIISSIGGQELCISIFPKIFDPEFSEERDGKSGKHKPHRRHDRIHKRLREPGKEEKQHNHRICERGDENLPEKTRFPSLVCLHAGIALLDLFKLLFHLPYLVHILILRQIPLFFKQKNKPLSFGKNR